MKVVFNNNTPIPCSHCGKPLIVGADGDRRCIECALRDRALTSYILGWLRTRNGAELNEAIGGMRLSDFELMTEELEHILRYRGKPPNWT